MFMKPMQQLMLNMGRVLATLYPVLKAAGPEVDMEAQQQFYYVLETEAQLLRERKERSISGLRHIWGTLYLTGKIWQGKKGVTSEQSKCASLC